LSDILITHPCQNSRSLAAGNVIKPRRLPQWRSLARSAAARDKIGHDGPQT
jgi:hypothetical protein